MSAVFSSNLLCGLKINVINGFNKIVSPLWLAETNHVLFPDFSDQKRLVLPVFEFHTQFLCLFRSLFHSVLSRSDTHS